MGTFHADCVVADHVRRDQRAPVPGMLVDTGSEHTWIAEDVLKAIGVVPEKRAVRFVLANGRTVSRDIGFAVIHVRERFTVDEVVFAKPGDLQLLGARTLEGLNLTVDPRRKRLVAAGPLPAAGS